MNMVRDLAGEDLKIVLIGADGQLGSDLKRVFGEKRLIPLYYPDFDLTRTGDAEKQIKSARPDVVINTAAFNKVDECENNMPAAFELNGYAVRNLAQWCLDSDSVLVHFSTDYVFDGRKSSPYTESDSPNPLNVYGVSKLCGEYFTLNAQKDNILIRTSGLYGWAGCWGKGYNFVDTMISLAKKSRKIKIVNDQWVTPTHTGDLAGRVKDVMAKGGQGLFHLTNEGECTWFRFAQEIFAQTGLNPEVEAVSSAAYPSEARRPEYSVLENRRAAQMGIPPMRHWKDALKDYLNIKGYIS
ncbi:MAG: dTDP-4-dehydrorhamnose reductase [Candidatus Aminicenantes bacterium]